MAFGTGGDVEHMLALGAGGVQVGTRFITTFECDADDHYKQAHLQAKSADVMLVPSPVGLPGRAIRNPFVDRVMAREDVSEPCTANCFTGLPLPRLSGNLLHYESPQPSRRWRCG